jgi:Replication initiator protein A
MELDDLFEQTHAPAPDPRGSSAYGSQPLLPTPEEAEEADHTSALTPPSKDSSLAHYIKAEVNFLRYPFFALTTRDLRKINTIEYREQREENGERQEIFWQVSRNVLNTIPGPFDKRVHRTVEEILDGLPRPIPQLIRLGPLYQLCKLLELPPTERKNRQKVVEALERIAATTIHSNYAFFRKAQKQWVRGTFNLFTVFFRGQDLPNGQVADSTYLFLHPLYVESLNSYYVKPLDYAYLRELANPLTQRLYEVLGLRFRGLRNSTYTRYEYDHLCQTLPIVPQRSLKDAKKVLAPHHEKLHKTGFLAKVEWRARQSVKPWEIFYWPGPKAQEEMQRARAFPHPQFSLSDSDTADEEAFRIQDLLDEIHDEIQDPRWEQSLPFYRRAIRDLGSDHVYARLAETRGASREGKIRKSRANYFVDLLSRDLKQHMRNRSSIPPSLRA